MFSLLVAYVFLPFLMELEWYVGETCLTLESHRLILRAGEASR